MIGDMVSLSCHQVTFVLAEVVGTCSARDYVEGMWRMLQQPAPEDFVLATGETHPVREFVEKSFAILGTTIQYVYFCIFYIALDLKLSTGGEELA